MKKLEKIIEDNENPGALDAFKDKQNTAYDPSSQETIKALVELEKAGGRLCYGTGDRPLGVLDPPMMSESVKLALKEVPKSFYEKWREAYLAQNSLDVILTKFTHFFFEQENCPLSKLDEVIKNFREKEGI